MVPGNPYNVIFVTNKNTVWSNFDFKSGDGYSEIKKIKEYNSRIIDICQNGEKIRAYDWPYFLFENGDIKNLDDYSYEKLDIEYSDLIYDEPKYIFIDRDDYMYYFLPHVMHECTQIKDENDQFVKYNAEYDYCSGFFVTDDNRLLELEFGDNEVAKEPALVKNKKVKSILDENIYVFEDGTEYDAILEEITEYADGIDDTEVEELGVSYDILSNLKSDDIFTISINRKIKDNERLEIGIDNKWVDILYKDSNIRPNTNSYTILYYDKNENELNWHDNQKYEFSAKQIIDMYSDSIEKCPEVSIFISSNSLSETIEIKTKIVFDDRQIESDEIGKLTAKLKAGKQYRVEWPNRAYYLLRLKDDVLTIKSESTSKNIIKYKLGNTDTISLNIVNEIGKEMWYNLQTSKNKDKAKMVYQLNGHKYNEILDIDANGQKVDKSKVINFIAFIFNNDSTAEIKEYKE